jgi:hypothetical protein
VFEKNYISLLGTTALDFRPKKREGEETFCLGLPAKLSKTRV